MDRTMSKVAAALFVSRKTVEAHLTQGLPQARDSVAYRTGADADGKWHR